jgi:HEAT repeat protein
VRRACRLAAVPVLLAACGTGAAPPPARPALPADWLRPVLDERLVTAEGRGLPTTTVLAPAELLDLLDGVRAGGRVARMAERELADQEPRQLAADLLALVEDRLAEPAVKVLAYDHLAGMGMPAVLPRLVLRLKYEKDWFANAFLAAALLAEENGAGLEAVRTVLATEDADAASRAAAAAVLPGLPGLPPDADFEAQWQRLLTAQQDWELGRLLAGSAEHLEDPDLEAEVWRMIARLRSQPLRPVDDARFVLSRMRCGQVVPPLLEAAHDTDAYVREHAYQTLAWIGYPVGVWARRSGFDYLADFELALRDAPVRLRVLDALGGSGLEEAAGLVLPWLSDGDYAERSAAADALLRCAGPGVLPQVTAALAGDGLSPEARYALELLRADLDPAAPAAAAPAGLASGEQARRDRWRLERVRRP